MQGPFVRDGCARLTSADAGQRASYLNAKNMGDLNEVWDLPRAIEKRAWLRKLIMDLSVEWKAKRLADTSNDGKDNKENDSDFELVGQNLQVNQSTV